MDSSRHLDSPSTVSLRWAALAGAVFFVLTMIHASTRGGAPSATDSGQEVFDYVARHQGRLQLGAVLLGLGMAAALVWLSGLDRVLTNAEGGTPALALVTFGGGVLSGREHRRRSARSKASRPAGSTTSALPARGSGGRWSS